MSDAHELLARLSTLQPADARRELKGIVLRMVNDFQRRAPGDQIGPRDRFVEVGFDSLRALDFTTLLSERFLCELSPTLLFDRATPEALVAYLADRILDLPSPKIDAPAADVDGLADEMERAGKLSETELRVLLARNTHRLRRLEREQTQPIAIVGMACRFPGGVDSPEALWRLLDEGRSAVADVPESRWPMSQLYHPERSVPGRINTRRAAMLDNVTDFDARFFNISPREANELDPQQRLLLEVCWEALERANIPASELYGTPVGVFLGIKSSEYFDSQKSGLPEESTAYRATGNSLSTASGRISYTFGFTGPCYPVDTACSSTLVALDLAVRSLRRGECPIAITGGANVLIDPHISIGLAKANMLSSDGKCKTFDASADGYVRAEGCGVLVLKPLARALADGDRVYAVIRGSAVNQDGASGGLTVPSGPAQEAVLRAALADGQVQPYQVGYVEAHGTGTELGDPIEITALQNVFGGEARFHGQPLFVGSGKTNHGHMECAAGVAGVMKVVLALAHEKIPKNLYFENPNPKIPWERIVAKVPDQPVEWRRSSVPRIAGISSFGFSGTNAHAVLEEPPLSRRPRRTMDERSDVLVPISARADADLVRLASSYADHLESRAFELAYVAFTAAAGRSHHSSRAAIVAPDTPVLVERLRALAAGRVATGVVRGAAPGVEPAIAFLFTGQGAQRAGMGRDLYQTERVFRETLDRCSSVLDDRLGVPLREVLWGEYSDRLGDTRYTQPAMVALQLSLVSLWDSWGVRPRWVLGHSIGEVAAACAAGVLTFERALILAEQRGKLMDGLRERGTMAVVQAPPEVVEPLLAGQKDAVCIAAYNGPGSVVISGRAENVRALTATLEKGGVRVVPLNVSHAFHSPLMDPMLDAFRGIAVGTSGARPTREWISTVDPDAPPAQDDEYWTRNVRAPVRFSEGMKRLAAAGCQVFVEIGPSNTLLALGRASVETKTAQWIPTQQPDGHGQGHALAALGRLYVAGVEPQWRNIHGGDAQKIDLPTYPFNRRKYWMQRAAVPAVRGEEVHPLLGARLPLPPLSGGETIYSNHLSERSPAYLVDHRVGDGAIFPAAGYVEAALALAATDDRPRALGDLKIAAALSLDERGREVVTVAREVDQQRRVEVKSRVAGGAWTTHAAWSYGEATPEPAPIDREAAIARCEELSVKDVYDEYAERGLRYGEAFRGLRRVFVGSNEVLAEVAVPVDPRYLVHPTVLDACFQAAGALLFDRDDMMLPVGVDRAVLHRPLAGEAWCRATVASEDEDRVAFDVSLFDEQGRTTLEVKGMRVVATTAFRAAGSARQNLIYSTKWVQKDEPRADSAEGASEKRAPWLLLADRGHVAAQLVLLLDEQGAAVTSLRRDQVDLEDAAAVDEIFSELGAPCGELVYLWALDDADVQDPAAEALYEHNLRGLLRVVQAAARAPGPPPRLTIVTRAAQQVGESDAALDLSQAPLWGFAAALAQEVPSMQCRCVDLPPVSEEHDAKRVFAELRRGDGERRVAWRGGQRHVARLVAGAGATDGLAIPPGPGYELRTSGYGTLQNLALRAFKPRSPGAGEVQIRVEAAALNFKDVLHAMGVLKAFSERRGIHRAEDQPLGLECAGRISAVGAGVEGFAVGDQVVALTDGTMASHVTTSASRVARKPDGWEVTEAAGLQTVFFTAAYGLLFLANLRPGDRVLVQSAAGGVGQAAVQICRWVGAEVFATASQGKWDHLRAQGVEHVMNSRTLDYSDEILRRTGGRGVDVVLNSLNEEHIPKSLAALARGGRFIEIGKAGIWEPARMAAARPDVVYHTFDLGEALADKVRYADLMARLAPGFSTEKLRPIPTKVFPLAEAIPAFQLLASGKTIGKIVLAMPETAMRVRGDRSYVVSGGLGALGLKTASWLSSRGAGAIVLLGRRAPSEEGRRAVEALRAAGARVYVVETDVSNRAALERALGALDGELPPVGGIVHAAGVLADKLVGGLDWERAWSVLAPKVAGGWNLHQWSAKRGLDWFVSYASLASVDGSAGQTSYAAANAFLEALAFERRRLGLPATSVHWGSWAGSGMAAAQPRVMRERMRRIGLRELRAKNAFEALEVVVAAGMPQAVVASASWPAYTKAVPGEASTFFSDLDGGAKAAPSESSGLRAALLAAPAAERAELLLGFTRRHLAAVVGISDPNEIALDTSFASLGLDSLLALDLRTLLERGLETTLSTTMVFDHPTLGQLVTYLDGLLPAVAAKQATA